MRGRIQSSGNLCLVRSWFALGVLATAGCSARSDAVDELIGNTATDSVASQQSEAGALQGTTGIAGLADQYLFQPASPEEMTDIRARIRELNGEKLEQFYRAVLDRSEATDEQRSLIEESLVRSKATGVSFLDFAKDDVKQILSKVSGVPVEEIPDDGGDLQGQERMGDEIGRIQQAACSIGYAACAHTSAWNSAVGQTICDPDDNCTPASYWDNVSNSACEFIACDTRLSFPVSTGQYIDGVTTAADCVIQWYGSLAKYSAGGNTFVGYGVAGPTACWFLTSNPAAHFNLK